MACLFGAACLGEVILASAGRTPVFSFSLACACVCHPHVCVSAQYVGDVATAVDTAPDGEGGQVPALFHLALPESLSRCSTSLHRRPSPVPFQAFASSCLLPAPLPLSPLQSRSVSLSLFCLFARLVCLPPLSVQAADGVVPWDGHVYSGYEYNYETGEWVAAAPALGDADAPVSDVSFALPPTPSGKC